MRLACIMHAPLPLALHLGSLFASVRLALFKTKVTVIWHTKLGNVFSFFPFFGLREGDDQSSKV